MMTTTGAVFSHNMSNGAGHIDDVVCEAFDVVYGGADHYAVAEQFMTAAVGDELIDRKGGVWTRTA